MDEEIKEFEVHKTLIFRVRAKSRKEAFFEIDRLFEYQWRPQYEYCDNKVREMNSRDIPFTDPNLIVKDLDPDSPERFIEHRKKYGFPPPTQAELDKRVKDIIEYRKLHNLSE